VAWFGPKRFASVVYGLFVLEGAGSRADEMFHLIALTVVLSSLAHSSTDVPIAYFARARERARGVFPSGPRYVGLHIMHRRL